MPDQIDDSDDEETFMGVREAAAFLGIHENTLRRWVDKKYLPAIVLKSGTRRFRVADVHRVRDEMWNAVATETLDGARRTA